MTKEAARIAGLYDRHAEAFDRLRGRSLSERSWLNRFLAELPAGKRVLDLGCGMGEPLAQHLIEQGCRMTGIDASPPLIALARERFPDQTWMEGDMRRLALGRAFGGVLAWDSFFHLTPNDQRAMFPVFSAHAVEGAALMFTSGRQAGEAIGTFEGEPLYHASLNPEEYRELLGTNGFTTLAYVPDDPDCGGHTVWLARRL